MMNLFSLSDLILRSPADPAAAPASGPTGEVTPPAAGLPTPPASDPAPEEKPSLLMDGEKNEDGTPKETPKETPAGEKFADVKDLTLPENFEFTSEEQAKGFSDLATEAGLTKEQAQKFLDFGAQAIKGQSEAGTKLWNDTQDAWRQDIMKDPVLGNGKDGFAPAVKAAVSKAIDEFSWNGQVKETKAAFDLTGAGNNKLLSGLFYNMARQLTEGSSVKGQPAGQSGNQGGPPKTQEGLANAIYPELAAQAAKQT